MAPWYNLAVALGIGLLIGLERERSKGDGPTRRPAGFGPSPWPACWVAWPLNWAEWCCWRLLWLG